MKLSLAFTSICLIILESSVQGFVPSSSFKSSVVVTQLSSSAAANNQKKDNNDHESTLDNNQRRATLAVLVGGLASLPLSAVAADDENKKFLQEYSDFAKTEEGWSFRDVKGGVGESPNKGDRVVFDWSGYTIGYFGRPFEAKGGPQGGAFDKDLDYSRTVVGSGAMVKALECSMTSMKPGGIRQVLVPYGELGYPTDDMSHERVGPKPTTFSGQRALNFVLENPRVDRTMLFNVKLIRVDKSDGKGGFIRGDKAA